MGEMYEIVIFKFFLKIYFFQMISEALYLHDMTPSNQKKWKWPHEREIKFHNFWRNSFNINWKWASRGKIFILKSKDSRFKCLSKAHLYLRNVWWTERFSPNNADRTGWGIGIRRRKAIIRKLAIRHAHGRGRSTCSLESPCDCK